MSPSRAPPPDPAVSARPSGRVEESILALRKLAASHPEDADIQRQLGDALFVAGRVSEASAAFVEAVRRNRSCAGAHAGLARIFDERGDAAAARAAYQQVVRYSPDNAAAQSRLGQLLTMFRVDEAEGPLRRALALNAGDIEAARHLGVALTRAPGAVHLDF